MRPAAPTMPVRDTHAGRQFHVERAGVCWPPGMSGFPDIPPA
jgi:hypothetical protein